MLVMLCSDNAIALRHESNLVEVPLGRAADKGAKLYHVTRKQKTRELQF